MYAVIKSGGKQYRVSTGETVRLESLAAETGASVTFSEVLAVGAGSDVRIGTPVVAGAVVTGTVLSHGRGDKVMILKFRRRKHSQKRQGHRQNYTEVRIDSIA